MARKDPDEVATETSQHRQEPQLTQDGRDREQQNILREDDDVEIERLLDRYPLRKSELTDLLAIFEQEKQKQEDPEARGTTSNSELLTFWSSFIPEEARSILPELSRVVECALTTVFVVVGSNNNNSHDCERFLEALCSLLGRRGERIVWEILFQSFAADDVVENNEADRTSKPVDRAYTEPLMSCLFRCALVTTRNCWDVGACELHPTKGWIQSLSRHSYVTRAEWNEWIGGNLLYRCLPTVFQLMLPYFDCKLSPPNFPLQWFPTREAISMVAMGLPGPYRDLYDSDRDGLSFRIFQQALLSFHGPTLIWIRIRRGDELGYYSRIPWKISTKWYGGSNADDCDNDESFLFRLSPNWNRYRQQSIQAGRKSIKYHQYLNVDRPDAVLKGLAVGGVAIDAPRLYLTESLEDCRCASIDHLFATGPLLGCRDEIFFDVDHLRVWAVCTEAEFEHGSHAGQLHVTMREGVRQRLAQVDRGQFVDDIELHTNLFEHRQQARGRADFVAHDDEDKGYYIQGKLPSL